MLSRLWPPIGRPALSDQFAAVAVTMGERPGSDDARCSTQIADLAWLPSRGAAVDCAHNDLSVRLDALERPVPFGSGRAAWRNGISLLVRLPATFPVTRGAAALWPNWPGEQQESQGAQVSLAGQLQYAELCWRARRGGT